MKLNPRDVLEPPTAKPSRWMVALGWILILSWAALELLWRWRSMVLWLLIFAVSVAVFWHLAKASELWQPPLFNGERSTVELDCEEIGLLLAPWGVDGSSVRCINTELMEKESGEKGRYWRPTRDEWMHRYCGFHHGTSMAHADPVTYVFWCHKVKRGAGA